MGLTLELRQEAVVAFPADLLIHRHTQVKKPAHLAALIRARFVAGVDAKRGTVKWVEKLASPLRDDVLGCERSG
jgi:hypothetical protein